MQTLAKSSILAENGDGTGWNFRIGFGRMHCRAFLDPDGHIREILDMDESQMPDTMPGLREPPV